MVNKHADLPSPKEPEEIQKGEREKGRKKIKSNGAY